MKHFAALWQQLDDVADTQVQRRLLSRYFGALPEPDLAWAVWFLNGNSPSRTIRTAELAEFCREDTTIPGWLMDVCKEYVGDVTETISLMIPIPKAPSEESLSWWMEQQIEPVLRLPVTGRSAAVREMWTRLGAVERIFVNRLLSGHLRSPVTRTVLASSLATFVRLPAEEIEHRLSRMVRPDLEPFQKPADTEDAVPFAGQPYAFRTSMPYSELPAESIISETMTDSGDVVSGFVAPWYSGLRIQMIRRKQELFVWSADGQLITEFLPSFEQIARLLPDGTVLSGQLTGELEGFRLSSDELAQHFVRKSGRSRLPDLHFRIVVDDLDEWNGVSVRETPFADRQRLLDSLELPPTDVLSSSLSRVVWSTDLPEAAIRERHARLRQTGAEGLMICQCGHENLTIRIWKATPLTCRAVMVHGHRSSGSHSKQLTQISLAVQDGTQLVPVATVDLALSESDRTEIQEIVRADMIERHGPVLRVKPRLVFELNFDGLRRSGRHKAGIVLQSPNLVRWCRRLDVSEIHTLADLCELLPKVSADDPAPRESERKPRQQPRQLFDDTEDSNC